MPHKSFHDFCPPELNFLHFQAKKPLKYQERALEQILLIRLEISRWKKFDRIGLSDSDTYLYEY